MRGKYSLLTREELIKALEARFPKNVWTDKTLKELDEEFRLVLEVQDCIRTWM
jgi:hypothetical protein